MTESANDRLLRPIIAVLALADGTLHLLLDFVLFRGRLFGNPFSGLRPPAGGPPRGAPPANPLVLPLPLNEMFVLNFVGAVVLVVLFWFAPRLLGARRWLVDLFMMFYAAATFAAWWMFGRPNPMGLGYLSKGIEIVLVLALAVHIWSILRPAAMVSPARAES